MDFFQILVLLALSFGLDCAKTGYGPGKQDWGFVDVRPGAHMFYWLYYTTANVTHYTQRPLAIWLQGGPGSSSTGEGNFKELGPLDLNGNYRNWTWVKDMNVLFIDSPVGSGFSYVDDIKLLTFNNNEIALDLVVFMQEFFNRHREFVNVPLHILSESYGGKTAPEFALELYYAIQRNKIKCNLTSLVLGAPLVSPIDTVLAWAPFLLNMGIVDQNGFNNIEEAANKTLEFVRKSEWYQATLQMANTQRKILFESRGVDFYNILRPTKGENCCMLLRSNNYQDMKYSTWKNFNNGYRDLKLEHLMRGGVSKALRIPSDIKWGAQSDNTVKYLMNDIMKPVIHIVNRLLNETGLKVGVISGQLDLICATAGTVKWIDKLRWKHRDLYINAPRGGFSVNGILEGYEKSACNFSTFWINRAGHMIPADNPNAMSYILKKLTNYG